MTSVKRDLHEPRRDELLISIDPWVFSWPIGDPHILMIEPFHAQIEGEDLPVIEGSSIAGTLVAKIEIPEGLRPHHYDQFASYCRGVVQGMAFATVKPDADEEASDAPQ